MLSVTSGRSRLSVLDPNSGYTINAPDVVAEDFNGQTVILNLSDGRYFNLGGIASPIWHNLLQGCTPQAIFDSLDQHQPELREEATRFIDQLIDLALIRRQTEAGDSLATAVNDVWSEERPQIEIFDDLAELIFADPIHDVDEQVGWPTPRPA
jgi:hypothetical protein